MTIKKVNALRSIAAKALTERAATDALMRRSEAKRTLVIATPDEYAAIPWLGRLFSTGRAASTTNRASYVGFAFLGQERDLRRVCITPKKMILWGKPGLTLFKDKAWYADKVDYAQYKALFNTALSLVQGRAEEVKDRQKEAESVADKHKRSLVDWKGKQAYIKFRNYPAWEEILGVDWKGLRIAIKGGGAKLRWIPMSLILDIKDRTGAAVKEVSLVKGAEAYTWGIYNGSKLTISSRAGRTVTLVKGTKFGVRQSASGKDIRLVFEELGLSIVFTMDLVTLNRIYKNSTLV